MCGVLREGALSRADGAVLGLVGGAGRWRWRLGLGLGLGLWSCGAVELWSAVGLGRATMLLMSAHLTRR